MWWVLRFSSVGTGLSFAAGTPVSPLARPGSTLACGDRQFPRRRRLAPVVTLSDGTGGGRGRQARCPARRVPTPGVVVPPRRVWSCSHAGRRPVPCRRVPTSTGAAGCYRDPAAHHPLTTRPVRRGRRRQVTPAQPRPVSGDPTVARPVLEEADVGRALTRIAHEIVERNHGAADVVVLGIPTRGVTLARRLGERIEAVEGVTVPIGSVDATMYRDDLRLRGVRPLEETEIPPDGIDGRVVVLVDDVLFSGRTVRAALDALSDLGRPGAVQLAVLIDRGHRELPIRADYVGKNIPTSLRETVHVLRRETAGPDGVLLGPADLPRPQPVDAEEAAR